MLLFSRHARLRMRERHVGERLVIDTIGSPDKTTVEGNQYTAAKRYGNNVLIVVYNKTEGIDFIVTVIFSPKLMKYLGK